MRRPRATRDQGFSLLELLVTMTIAGTLAAIGGTAIFNWQRTSEHKGTAQSVMSSLREAAERSVSEGRTYCVDFTSATSYQLWRYACGTGGTAVNAARTTQSRRVRLAESVTVPVPAKPCPSTDSCIYFYPRGTATPATVNITSTVRSRVFTVHVEGLTARVYM